MFKTVASKNNEINAPNLNHFMVLSLTLFSLLFVFSTYIYSEQIFIAFQRKFIVPQMEKKFGFRGKKEKIPYSENFEITAFVIDSVEPGGLFAAAGFEPGDVPEFHGCRFFVIGKTNEAMFYSELSRLPGES